MYSGGISIAGLARFRSWHLGLYGLELPMPSCYNLPWSLWSPAEHAFYRNRIVCYSFASVPGMWRCLWASCVASVCFQQPWPRESSGYSISFCEVWDDFHNFQPFTHLCVNTATFSQPVQIQKSVCSTHVPLLQLFYSSYSWAFGAYSETLLILPLAHSFFPKRRDTYSFNCFSILWPVLKKASWCRTACLFFFSPA